MTSLMTPAEINDCGGTGTFSTSQWQLAIDMAEFDISDALDTFLTPTTVTEEYLWPGDNGKLLLNYNHVISLTSLTAKHSLLYDCTWVQDAECGVILDSELGWIQAVAKNFSLSKCNCSGSGMGMVVPDRLLITYNAGYTAAEAAAGTATGKALRMAICMRAREWISYISQGSDWQGNFAIASWSSMDYSERREYGAKISALGPGPLSMEASRILGRLRRYTAIHLRGSGRL